MDDCQYCNSIAQMTGRNHCPIHPESDNDDYQSQNAAFHAWICGAWAECHFIFPDGRGGGKFEVSEEHPTPHNLEDLQLDKSYDCRYNQAALDEYARMVAEKETVAEAERIRVEADRQQRELEQLKYAARKAAIEELFAKAKFRRQEITIALSTEAVVQAAGPSYRGLVILRESHISGLQLDRGRYQIAHAASGFRIWRGFPAQRHAKIVAFRLAEELGIDWTQDKEAVVQAAEGKISLKLFSALRADPFAEVAS